jgi:prolyl-tRNA editing enzyme YbaK/EbsC (Cys-tRNA(Pro) deacylase)
VAAHGVPADTCANCVVVAGRRGQDERIAACVVLATTRADVNGLVRRALEARKASFLPQERAVELTGMEHGGILPLGLPPTWPVLVDAAVASAPVVVLGSGLRRSKLALPGALVTRLPSARVVDGLGVPVTAP